MIYLGSPVLHPRLLDRLESDNMGIFPFIRYITFLYSRTLAMTRPGLLPRSQWAKGASCEAASAGTPTNNPIGERGWNNFRSVETFARVPASCKTFFGTKLPLSGLVFDKSPVSRISNSTCGGNAAVKFVQSLKFVHGMICDFAFFWEQSLHEAERGAMNRG